MLPLQPADTNALSTEQETLMAQELADQFNAYVCDELVGVLADMARDIIKENHIDPESPLGYDLVYDLIRRITVTNK